MWQLAIFLVLFLFVLLVVLAAALVIGDCRLDVQELQQCVADLRCRVDDLERRDGKSDHQNQDENNTKQS